MPSTFDTFFRAATGKPKPYGYQCRLAKAGLLAPELASLLSPKPTGADDGR